MENETGFLKDASFGGLPSPARLPENGAPARLRVCVCVSVSDKASEFTLKKTLITLTWSQNGNISLSYKQMFYFFFQKDSYNVNKKKILTISCSLRLVVEDSSKNV